MHADAVAALEKEIEEKSELLRRSRVLAEHERKALVIADFTRLGWHPRSTAPMDGTAFLSWKYSYNGKVNSVVVTWRGARSWHQSGNYGSYGYNSLIEDCFDLWHPMPPMPEVLRGDK